MVSAHSGVFFGGAVHARRRGQLEPAVSWALGKKRTRREIADARRGQRMVQDTRRPGPRPLRNLPRYLVGRSSRISSRNYHGMLKPETPWNETLKLRRITP